MASESKKSAVVRIADVQMRVQEGDTIKAPRLAGEVGDTLEFDQVLLVNDGDIKVGSPNVAGASVKAEVLEHGRDKKIIVFKMKRRKNYRRRKGHRQQFTQLKIASIQG